MTPNSHNNKNSTSYNSNSLGGNSNSQDFDWSSQTLTSQNHDLVLLKDGAYSGLPNNPDCDGIGAVVTRLDLMKIGDEILLLAERRGSEGLLEKVHRITCGSEESITVAERKVLIGRNIIEKKDGIWNKSLCSPNREKTCRP